MTQQTSNVFMRDITGIGEIPTFKKDSRKRLSVDEKREWVQNACNEVAAELSIYDGHDVYVSKQIDAVVDNSSNSKSMHNVDSSQYKIRVTNHLVAQLRKMDNEKFAVIQHEDGELLAVSLAEYVGLGKPEANY